MASSYSIYEEGADGKNRFFQEAVHQLKSPVSIIQWCLNSVLENREQLDAQTVEMVVRSLNQAESMSRLVLDLLRIFKLMRNDQPMSLAPVHPNQLIDEVIEQYKPEAERAQVRLALGPVEVLPIIYSQEQYLKDALINLVDNAIKYSPHNGAVTVSGRLIVVKGDPPKKKGMLKKKETLTKDKKYVEISVQDEGMGISEADQHQLFAEFFRTQAARDAIPYGTGLGLVVVKRCIEALGGVVLLESKLNKGSKFILRVPCGE